MTERKMDATASKCKNIITDFINEHLCNNIDFLKYFDFELLKNDKRYGKCTSSSFDCDDTILARAIYYIIWSETIPSLEFEQIGSGKLYRGDTLNSFSTLLGKKSPDGTFPGTLKYTSDISVLASVTGFYKTYHTIGNFMLLPNISPLVKSKDGKLRNGHTLNQIRNTLWKDYFDLFLLNLRYCLTNDCKCNQKLAHLVRLNGFYFNHFGNDIWKIAQVNMLSDYVSLSGEVSLIFQPHGRKSASNLPPSDKQATEYVDTSLRYISRAEGVIGSRSDAMICILKAKL